MDIIRTWELNLNADHVLRAQGSNPDIIRARKYQLYEIAEWAVKEGIPLLDPVVIQKSFAVERFRHQNIELMTKESTPTAKLSGSLITKHLAMAEEVIVIVCTIGDTLELMAAELMTSDPMYGWALDSLGTAAIEFLATLACRRIENQAEKNGLEYSIPLSPGMIGWEVDRGQQQIFNLIDGQKIGVSLNKNYQMHPAKTISFVIGIGPSMIASGRTCDYCAMSSTCRYQNHYTN